MNVQLDRKQREARQEGIDRKRADKQRAAAKSNLAQGNPKRDWREARAKISAEDGCRVCGYRPVEAAHIIGRVHDQQRGSTRWVDPLSVVPLCRDHHQKYDAHEFDLLPYLRTAEQAQAVWEAGGIENARIRTAPSQYERKAA